MLTSIVNFFQALWDGISGFFSTARSFFTLISKVFNALLNSFGTLSSFLPPALAIVVSVSLLIFIIKVILGSSSNG